MTDSPVPYAPLLTRDALVAAEPGAARPTPPVRIVHLGLGAFHRAHQAWYTANANANAAAAGATNPAGAASPAAGSLAAANSDAAPWGIAAFTGRDATVADELRPQGGLFTLVERADDGDRAEVIDSIVEAHDGSNLGRLTELFAAPTTAIVTITVTEVGYRMTGAGLPDDSDPSLTADRAWLRQSAAVPAGAAGRSSGAFGAARGLDTGPVAEGPTTALGRLVLGLAARWGADAGPIAVVPCDNMPANGTLVARSVAVLADEIAPTFAEWIASNVSFVSTSVDRITPRTTPADRLIAEGLTGWRDRATVVTEPFSDWVLSGDFPAGRPEWQAVGARFVDDIEPFENRKLWLLNGAHSLLAYGGLLRGHSTVAEAMADDVCRRWVDDFWQEAVRHLPAEGLDLDDYRAALVRRFTNARIEHRLSQISDDAVLKLRVRVLPTLTAERAEGRDGAGCVRVIGAWIALLLALADTAPPPAPAAPAPAAPAPTAPAPAAPALTELADRERDAIRAAIALADPVPALVALIEPALRDDGDVVAAIRSVVAELSPNAPQTPHPPRTRGES